MKETIKSLERFIETDPVKKKDDWWDSSINKKALSILDAQGFFIIQFCYCFIQRQVPLPSLPE
jgi:hypothetical protein